METSASLSERLRTLPDEAAWRRLADIYQPLAEKLGLSLNAVLIAKSRVLRTLRQEGKEWID
jgi:hypothetical protein